MADTICRTLRDGGLEGEHAPALTIKDSIATPFGLDVFTHVLTQLSNYILAGKSQSRGIVIVGFCRSPSFYVDLLKGGGIDVTTAHKWIQILDCYTDPLGWKVKLNIEDLSQETSVLSTSCKDVRDLDNLYSSIIELGKVLVGQGKGRFTVAIDLVSEMLRHASITSVAGLLSNLRSHGQVSSIFWLLHSDLHEARVTNVLEYLSSIVASLEPFTRSMTAHRGDLENLSLLEQNLRKGRFNVRFKRRNGRVRVMCEELLVELSGISFTPVLLSEDEIINQRLLPKVQFNLHLSEKEQTERAKVVLPFEHQGNGEPVQIYDGRRSLNEDTLVSTQSLQTDGNSGKGQIIYFRDSDDEMPDSDEDPDDDLDI
ncbi:elongator complex protein 5 [Mangifera indica]|uniref:elongator complex protein 5 n=1 Tax=Mangifera indica TaxID=29780 RepID=UPI001CFAA5D7|nr:elongator complex protein 5 [Mangifera indica]XP_044468775.1 elongator complex protein 5 [Mangifera indica]